MQKNFWRLSLLLWLVLGLWTGASAALKTSASVPIVEGYVENTTVLADDSGQVFLEFLQGDRVAKQLDQQIYSGEILPPVLIDAPAKAPRARMREVVSFEIFSDTNEALEFIDQYAAIHAKKRLRLSLQEGQKERRQGAQMITTFPAEANIGQASLWRYDAARTPKPWQRLGGIAGDAPGEAQVFSAFLHATGVYTIWDENPAPTFVPEDPLFATELAEVSPFPSVETELDSAKTFVEDLLGNEALFTDELEEELNQTLTSLDDSTEEILIPAVEPLVDEAGNLLDPAVTSQLPVNNQEPALTTNPLANLQALPSNSPSPLSTLLEIPAQAPTPTNEAGLGENLQASTFQNFGVEEGDLPEAGGLRFHWALLLVLALVGFSVYATRKKPY